jgi:hypothetical protein
VPGSERGAVPQVHHPLAGLDAAPQLVRVGLGRRGQVGTVWPGQVSRSHVRVVGGVALQPGQQLAEVGLFVLVERRVAGPLLADGRRVGLALGGRAERPEPVGGQHACLVGKQRDQPVCGRVLEPGELLGVVGPEQVGRPVEPNSREPPVNTARAASVSSARSPSVSA